MSKNFDLEAGTRTCTKCGETFPATREFFYGNKRASDACQSRCRQCYNAALAAGRLSRLQEVRVMQRRACVEWRARNPEKVAELNRSYYSRNKSACLALWRRRRARKLEAPGFHTAAEIQRKLHSQGGHCYYCSSFLGDGYHVEHKLPLSRGGSDSIDNIVLSCPGCNLRKHDKTAEEFLEQLLRECLEEAVAA